MPPVTQMRGGRVGTLGGYPNSWFDISSTYIPSTMKEMFRWCHYLYASHSEIAPVVKKKCAYVITKLIYETEREKSQALWKELLEVVLKIREFEFKLALDEEVYGNAYASILFPFERYLVCGHCKHSHMARSIKWQYKDHAFFGTCTRCKQPAKFQPKDVTIRSRLRIKLIRWNPQYVDIRFNPLTDRSEYIYRIPKWLRQRITNPKINRVLVEDTPLEFLEAIRDKKNIMLQEDNIYVLKNPSVSAEDDAYGMPPMLPVFKDAWLFQTYKRAQEAIALEHVLPLTILVPEATSGGHSPHANVDLTSWSQKTMDIIHRWRRDPNSIYTMPFPLRVENIRGDAKALGVQDEMNQIRQQIAGGLDVPQEFIYGGLNWSGSSISLRVLENLFLSRIERLNDFLQHFVVPKLRRFLSLPNIGIRHADFKMADDAQQRQIALGLRQTNTISDRTTIEELGFDPEREAKRKREEAVERNAELISSMKANAEAQGMAMHIQAKYQNKADDTRMSNPATVTQMALAKTGAVSDGFAMKELPKSPALYELLAHHFIKKPGTAMDKQLELAHIEDTDPRLAKAIKERMRTIKQQGNDKFLKPLPEQRAPRRANSPV